MITQNELRRNAGVKTAWRPFFSVLLCCLLLGYAENLFGQMPEAGRGNLYVRGVVVDNNDPPQKLIGVTVSIKGTTEATMTDVSGFFSISVNRDDILVFNYIGYRSEEFRVIGNEANLSIALAENVTELEQVVATGMTSEQRQQIASSVGVIERANFENKPITRLSQALVGGTTGIFVSQESGLPGGDGARIKIRGVASLLGSDPLVIVDGFEFDMDKLDPSTVESITVLKDAAAAANYGAKAGNGVIVITTKRGTAGKVAVQYNGYFGVQQPLYLPEFVSAPDYMRYMNQAQFNSGAINPAYTDEEILWTEQGTDPTRYPNTNWRKETMNLAAPIQDHNFNISGGNTTARFALSAQYLKQDGIYRFVDDGTSKMNVRINTTVNLLKNLYVYTDLAMMREDREEPITVNQTILDYIYRIPPTVVGEYPRKEGQRPDYTYYGMYKEWSSPLLNLKEGTRRNTLTDDVVINARPVWHVNEDLTLSGQASYKLRSGVIKDWREDAYVILDYFTDMEMANFGMVNTTSYPVRSYMWQVGLNGEWNKTLGDLHELKVLGGWNQEERVGSSVWDVITLRSFYADAYYTYDGKYMLRLSARADGSSLFAKKNKWAAFPSAALAWNADREPFMQNARWIDNLKFRLSYGILGNIKDLPPYRYQSYINASGTETGSGNANLDWERVSTFNAGVDGTFFDGKLDLTAEYFNKITHDLIVDVPATTSSAIRNTFLNAGEAQSQGFEVSLGYNHAIGTDTRLSLNVGMTHAKTRLREIVNGRLTSTYRGNPVIFQEGRSIMEYYGYGADGLLSQGDLDTYYPIFGGYNVDAPAQHPGDVKYLDMNGDGVISDSDQGPIGAIDPETWGFANLNFSWKNLDLEAQATYSGYVPVYYTKLISNPLDGDQGGTPQNWHLDYWSESNPDARLPRPTTTAGNNGLFSTFWKADGSYIRVKYLQVGYHLPRRWVEKIFAESVYLYTNVQNPFTFTKLDLIDPESKGTYSTYPMFRTYSFGLNLRF